jgi:uracil-DNA glycosylase family 4
LIEELKTIMPKNIPGNLQSGLAIEPENDCRLCPRLAEFRSENTRSYPQFCNRPVPAFGQLNAALLIVGLAPGLKGANRTGRPFTGDGAGDVLYPALLHFGFAKGQYLGLNQASASDGLQLLNSRITNAVRCVPPGNKPTPIEIRTCGHFLGAEVAAMPALRAVLALGRVAHDATLRAFGQKLKAHPFAHGARHAIGDLMLYDSYHCSRYNLNTCVLTRAMFDAVLARIKSDLHV